MDCRVRPGNDIRDGSVIQSRVASIEGDAEPSFLAPDDVTAPLELIAGHKKREAVWNVKRAQDFQRRAGIREILDRTIHAAAAELDGSGLKHAATRGYSVFIHGLGFRHGTLRF